MVADTSNIKQIQANKLTLIPLDIIRKQLLISREVEIY